MPTGCFFRLISIPDLGATSHFYFRTMRTSLRKNRMASRWERSSRAPTSPTLSTRQCSRWDFARTTKVQMVASGLNSGSNNPTLCKPHSASATLTDTLPFSAGSNDHLGYKVSQNFHFRRSKRVFFEAVNRLPSAELSSTLTRTRFTLKSNHIIYMKISNGSSSQMHLDQRRILKLSSDFCDAAIQIS